MFAVDLPHATRAIEIQAKGLGKTYRDRKTQTVAFEDVTLDIYRGEFLAIVGPSGCGKTSLLRALTGLEQPSCGAVAINRAQVTHTPPFAMVFQEHGLLPWMSLRRNILFMLEQNTAMASSQRATIADSYLAQVGLSEFSHYLPHAVSGGMRQRISLARAFAFESDILVMDEPFIYLDFQTRIILHRLLISLWQPNKKTVIFVTHDIEEAVMLADRVAVFSPHPGTIRQIVNIELAHPRDPITTRKQERYTEYVDEVMGLLG